MARVTKNPQAAGRAEDADGTADARASGRAQCARLLRVHGAAAASSIIGFFIEWAYEHGLREPIEVTRPVLERYQRYLFFYRKKNGEPLTFRSQHARLVPLRVWFRWMTRQNHILHNPASEIELPRLGRTPAQEHPLRRRRSSGSWRCARSRSQSACATAPSWKCCTATGMRRLEIVRLKLFDLSLDRGLILVRQGKGKKDRYVPIGERAAAWLRSTSPRRGPSLPSSRTTSRCSSRPTASRSAATI